MQPLSKPLETLQAVHGTTALLGDFAVGVNDTSIDAERWKLKHPRLLWPMLCLARGHCVSRDEAAEALLPHAGVQVVSQRPHHGIIGEAGMADARRLIQL